MSMDIFCTRCQAGNCRNQAILGTSGDFTFYRCFDCGWEFGERKPGTETPRRNINAYLVEGCEENQRQFEQHQADDDQYQQELFG